MAISRDEALECFQSDDLIGIGMEADAVRRRLHPDGVVSYTLDGKINYADPGHETSAQPSNPLLERVFKEISSFIAQGATSITLQGDVPPTRKIPWFQTLFRRIKVVFPTVWLHSLSATEILTLAETSASTIPDTIAQLKDVGLDSIPGNDAGILDDAVQNHSFSTRWQSSDWLAVHRAAHKHGMQTTATMMFGGGEAFEHRINHLEALANLQEETGGFAAFTPYTFAPQSSTVRGFEEATAVEYLKTLAISRMYLDTIPNIQSNLETQGLKVLQVGLRFGGNDAGSIMLASGANSATEEQVRQVIRDAGFKPMQRDALYRTMFLA